MKVGRVNLDAQGQPVTINVNMRGVVQVLWVVVGLAVGFAADFAPHDHHNAASFHAFWSGASGGILLCVAIDEFIELWRSK